MAESLPPFVSLLSLRARRRDYALSATITVSVGITYDSPRIEHSPPQMSVVSVVSGERWSLSSERASLSLAREFSISRYQCRKRGPYNPKRAASIRSRGESRFLHQTVIWILVRVAQPPSDCLSRGQILVSLDRPRFEDHTVRSDVFRKSLILIDCSRTSQISVLNAF